MVACSANEQSPGDVSDAAAPPSDEAGTEPDAGARPRDGGTGHEGGAAAGDAGAPGTDAALPLPPGVPIDAGATVTGTITVDPSTQVGAIPAGFVGFSYEKTQMTSGLFAGGDAALISLFKLVGPGLLRIGGNSVDRTEWYSAPSSDGSASATITTGEVDALAAFAKASGWKVVYGVDMKLSNPSLAADEATYVVGALGAALYGLEIGNEPDLYSSTVLSPSWSYSAFTAQWGQFASAILGAAGQATPLTGPASAANYSSWTVPFAADDGSQIQLLTQHYYRGNGQLASSTVDALLTPDPNLGKELDALDQAAKGANIKGGYRLAECNSYYNGGAPNVSDAYGTALWVIDFLFQNAQHGSAGVNLHGGGNGPGYTPIADSSGSVVGARPEFYGVLLFALAGQGPLYKTTVTISGGLNVAAYAVGAPDGSTNVIVVSKDASQGVHATVDVGAAVTTAGVTYLQGPSLDATDGVTLAATAIDPSGSFAPTNGPVPLKTSGTTVTVDVPAASAALIHAK
jgi:hypothetical protein